MKPASPVTLSAADIARVKSWVIFEDACVIAFNKPSGLSSQGGRIRAHTLDDLLWAFARSSGKRPRLVHRLDRDTSGCLMLARKPAVLRAFQAALRERSGIRKTYLALVEGRWPPGRGRTVSPSWPGA